MLVRPVFKQKFHVEPVPGEGYFLLSETERFVLTGPDVGWIVPLIDGRRTSSEIVGLLAGSLSPDRVLETLKMLEAEGHVEEAAPWMPPGFASFWQELGVDTRSIAARLRGYNVQVLALDGVDPLPMRRAVRDFGMKTDGEPSFQVVLANDYLHPELEAINRDCLDRGLSWMLVKPNGIHTWIGPVFMPHATACWRCLEARLRANREVESYIERRKGRPGPFPTNRTRVPQISRPAYDLAALQLVRWLARGGDSPLSSQLFVFDVVNVGLHGHPVVRRPQCPDCGDPRLGCGRAGEPVVLHAVRGSQDFVGGHRSEPPETTFQRYQHHISPISGVVSNLYPSVGHGSGPLRVYLAGHNFALKNDSLYFLSDGLRTHSSGKGRTDAQARTSALCEALERYSGVYRGEEPTIRARLRELGADGVHPNACMLYSERQYREREQWLQRGARFQVVPLPFDEDAEIEWTPVYSWTEKRKKYLPTGYLYFGYPNPPEEFYFWADSNGNAAGSSLEDAIVQGYLELVERDSVCLWWYSRAHRPQVDLSTFDDEYFDSLLAFYAGIGREVWVLDLTSDTGVPAFAALSRRLRGPTEDIVIGFGAHFDAHLAITRALTELNQFIPAVLNVLPDGRTQYGFDDPEVVRWWRTATLQNQHYLAPLPAHHTRRASDYAPVRFRDLEEEVHHCFGVAERLGLEVLLLDQTRPDIGLPVVKVLVPGLRHFWARFAPGRLYDVPVRLGWIDRPLLEEELNPFPMFV